MAENELQILIKGIFSRIKEKYGYTEEQALIYLKGYENCAKEHQQSLEKRDKMLRDTVAELCEAKRLLKEVVGDLNATVAEVYNGGVICEYCKWESQIGECCCPSDGGCDTDYRWRYADEAEKLLKDEELIM